MKLLIVNADDFGFTRGVNAGIIQGFREGIITSTTLMANGDAFDDAIAQARANPKLGVGCHFVLVGGKCVAPKEQVPSLTDSEGNLPATLASLMKKLFMRSVKQEELVTELRAQVSKIAASGLQPSHFDSHKHTHLHPLVLNACIGVAEEFGIHRLRKPFEDISRLLWLTSGEGRGSWMQRATAIVSHFAAPTFRRVVREHKMLAPEHFWGIAATGQLNAGTILAMIEVMPEGTSEMMCHPGHCDSDLEHSSTRLKLERERELEAVTSPEVREVIQRQGIQLTDFRGMN